MSAIDDFKGEYAFLSNFYPCVDWIEYGGMTYPSVEHAYQAAKVSPLLRAQFQVGTAAEAKKLGRTQKCRSDWDDVKLDIMEELLRCKFNSLGLALLLINTRPQELIEGNWWGDTFWGVCRGKGENHLGKLLMKIRAELK